MKKWLNVLAAVVVLFLVAATPLKTPIRRVAYGKVWDCFPTAHPNIFECKDGNGRTIYLTGDTETGCDPTDPRPEVQRQPETQCYALDGRAGGDNDFNDALTHEDFSVVPCEDEVEEGDIEWLDALVDTLRE